MPSVTGLRFYPKSHRYKLDGKWVPGVTTILGCLDKPAIPKWAAKQVAEYVADNPGGIAELRYLGRNAMVAALKEIPWQHRDDAGKRGNVLHDYAEALLRGQEIEVEDAHVGTMESALAFMADWEIEPLMIEAPIASREHSYAGTLDLIAKYRDPRDGSTGVAIFDWKSGKALYPECALQMAAYAYAEFAVVDGKEASIPACDAAFGVQIREDGYDVAQMTFGPGIADEFYTIRRVHAITKRMRGDWKVPGSGYVGALIQTNQEEVDYQ